MLKRALAATLFAAAVATTTAAPASADPTLPFPTPGMLIVISYYTDYQHHDLVGQVWYGCGDPLESWGEKTSHVTVGKVPCDPPTHPNP
ncbi:MAG TPA: DUF6289 family protein [Lentzea sp.]